MVTEEEVEEYITGGASRDVQGTVHGGEGLDSACQNSILLC
jgi:hypothetical protein